MSFGLSRGRELNTEGYGIRASDLPPMHEVERIDPRSFFADPARPFELEIGSGKGTFLLQQAELQKDTNFLGIEWAGEFARYAGDRFRRHAFDNVRIMHGDAVEFIQYRCPDGVARVVHLYFSDPWPKKRHHKRRVVQDESLQEMHRILEPGGELRIVTDHVELWAWCEEHVSRYESLFERCSFQPPESASGDEVVGTNFERKFAREGRAFHAMTLLRREST